CRQGAARPQPPPRPGLLHRSDRRGLRPGAGPHPRWGRALRRPPRAVRAPAARRRLRPLPGADPSGADGGGAAGEGRHLMTPTVEAPIRARLGGPLKLAIPRGALWEETLDALDGIGLHTAEMRGDSRSLVFSANGLTLVTMRPSDIPT